SLGFAATNALTKADVRATVGDAIKGARASSRRTPITFATEDAVEMDWSVPERRRLADVAVDEKIREVGEMDREVMALGYKVPARYFQMSNNRIEKYFANSEGSRIRSYSPRLRLFYFLTVAHDGDAEQTYRNYGWSGGWDGVRTLDWKEKVLEEARSMQRSLVEGKKTPEGKMDLVVGPQVSGIASHESCGHPTEADRVLGREASQAGKSFLAPDAIGTRVGSRVVNVVDDPTVEHAIAYYATDDEGVRARRRYLYKEGVVHEFLQNRETAAALGTRSNGAARAVNYNVEAIVRMANTFVEPGDHTVEELLEDVRHGVYMKSFMEWNIDDKRYNAKYAGREAYLVEDGEVRHPVRNTVIELTTPAFWSAVDAVGKDLDFEAGFCGKSDPGQALDASLGGPSMRLRNVTLR
ncbi:MAG: TldD/PmbA family protein, partial [Methanobacteriota archaeon]